MNATRKLLISGIMLAASYSVNADNILHNGSFEMPEVPNGSAWWLNGLPGWIVPPGCPVELQNHSAGTPFDGAQHIHLETFCNSFIVQPVATTEDEVYRLVYHYSPHPGVGNNRIRVRWNGGNLKLLQTSGAGLTDTAWEEHIHLVQATAASTSIEFRDVSPGGNMATGYIDDVILEPLDTPDMICKAVRDVVSSSGAAMTLCSRLNSLELAYDLGLSEGTINFLKDSFARTVNSYVGRYISEEDAELLIAAVNNLP